MRSLTNIKSNQRLINANDKSNRKQYCKWENTCSSSTRRNVAPGPSTLFLWFYCWIWKLMKGNFPTHHWSFNPEGRCYLVKKIFSVQIILKQVNPFQPSVAFPWFEIYMKFMKFLSIWNEIIGRNKLKHFIIFCNLFSLLFHWL